MSRLHLGGHRKTNEEELHAAALEALFEEQTTFLNRLHGRKLIVKKLRLRGDLSDAKASGMAAAAAGPQTARAVAEFFLKDLLGEIPFMDFVKEITENVWYTLIGQIAGFTAGGVDVARAGKAWVMAGANVYRMCRDHRKAVKLSLNGTGQEALHSVEVLLRRNLIQHSYKALKNTASGLAQIGLTASGYGSIGSPIVGGLGAITDLIHRIVWMVIEFREAYKANKLLKNKTEDIDVSIFRTCPLLGAYILTGTTRSNILSFVARDLQNPGWMNEVEQMNRKIAGLLSHASMVIADARWELDVPFVLDQAHYDPGQVIRRDDGDFLIKLQGYKQKVTHYASDKFQTLVAKGKKRIVKKLVT